MRMSIKLILLSVAFALCFLIYIVYDRQFRRVVPARVSAGRAQSNNAAVRTASQHRGRHQDPSRHCGASDDVNVHSARSGRRLRPVRNDLRSATQSMPSRPAGRLRPPHPRSSARSRCGRARHRQCAGSGRGTPLRGTPASPPPAGWLAVLRPNVDLDAV